VEQSFPARRITYGLIGAAVVLAGGTIGFHHILDESWLSAFYRAVVTSSLAGIDSVPDSTGGQVLSVVLIFCGVTIFAFVGAALVETIARGVLSGAWSERRRRRTIEHLREHTIICGHGRVGQRIADEFQRAGAEFVIVDSDPEEVRAARDMGSRAIEGDAIEDEDLRAAGLERAKALVAALDSDANNLYVTLSARNARPDLLIVARASDEDAERKLRLAGADRVVLPYATAGRVMAGLVLKPQVASFLNVVTSGEGQDLRFEQIEVTRGCPALGKSIRELSVRQHTGASIVAVAKKGGSYHTRPSPDTVFDQGDVVIGVGTGDEIRALEDLFAPAGASVGS
jgi:voltage-gated potassium channel